MSIFKQEKKGGIYIKKNQINLFIFSCIISAILIYTVNISPIIYFLVFSIEIIFIANNINFRKNKEVMWKILLINIVFYVIYIFNTSQKNNITNTSQYLLLIIGVIVFLFVEILDHVESDEIENTSLNRKIFKKREKDFEELENYIKLYNTVGLNGSWGTGKTHIVKKFMFNNKNNYEFIEIDLLTCNLKELQNILVESFEKVFYSNKIIPKNANKLKQNIEKYSFFLK